MFGSRRGRLPFIIPLLAAVALGYLLAGGVGSLVGALLFLPLLILKIMFMFFVFGMLLRFAGGGRHWKHGWTPHEGRRSAESEGAPADEPEAEEERDWEEALRAAKREIDKLFPNPRE